jgi:hypothetical protein
MKQQGRKLKVHRNIQSAVADDLRRSLVGLYRVSRRRHRVRPVNFGKRQLLPREEPKQVF